MPESQSKATEGRPKGRKATKADCAGCYDDHYNHVGNSADGVCWSLKDATIIDLVLVPIDEVPPHRQKPQKRPSCYRKQRYARYRPDQLKDGYVKGWS